MTSMGSGARLLALVLALSLGCATTGQRFDPDSVPLIRIGESTATEVRDLFGQPESIRSTGSGRLRFRYRFVEERSADTRMLTRIAAFAAFILGRGWIWSPVNVRYRNRIEHRLDVVFDGEGVVDDYAYERTETPTRQVY